MPRAVANDLPDWLEPYLEAVYGDRLEAEMAGLNAPAPVDLRVNLFKTDRDAARRALAAEKICAEPRRGRPSGCASRSACRSPVSRRSRTGSSRCRTRVRNSPRCCSARRPGMRVVDFCAGAGGKTLALAAAMKNRGKLVACDTAGWRLDRSGQRLRRAGATNVERSALASERDPWVKRHAKSFDRVLVDAPCLGIGSWRRNPDAKWRATPNDLAELQIRQHDILASAARLVKPAAGSPMSPARCCARRTRRRPSVSSTRRGFYARPRQRRPGPRRSAPPAPRAWRLFLRLTPARHGTDGFFVALFERSPPRCNRCLRPSRRPTSQPPRMRTFLMALRKTLILRSGA